MRPLLVVILDKFCEYGPKMLLVQDDDVVKALSPQSPDTRSAMAFTYVVNYRQ
jgi:hypothetical protein